MTLRRLSFVTGVATHSISMQRFIRIHFSERPFYLLLASILLITLVTTSARSAVDCDKVFNEPDYKPEQLTAPMRFFSPERYACLGNAVNNPYLAVGTITNETPAVFAEFAKNNPPNSTIEFTSPGGDLLAALKLGSMIRAGGYDTSLGEFCASACAYSILGGVKRYVGHQVDEDRDYDYHNAGASGTKFGIHQFYHSAALEEPQKKAFSATDASADQMLMGILLEYTLRMGVDVRLVSTAASIPPWQNMRWLTQDEMIAWNIDNTHRLYTDLVLRAFGQRGSYVEVRSTKGADESYLRMFCKNNINEPLFVFVTDRLSPASEKTIAISRTTEQLRGVLSYLNIHLELGRDKRTNLFQVIDVQSVPQDQDKIRTYAVVRPIGFNRQDTERLTRVALQDNGELARSEWTFQDFTKFNIKGDRKLIGLAMRNCVD
jgi:hypothetical protein